MALSPYLQMLLARKRTPVDTATAAPAPVGPVNPVPFNADAPPPVALQPRESAQPVYAGGGAVSPTTNLDAELQPRMRSAAETVQGYNAGLHPDKDISQMMVPYKRNRGLATLEAVGDIAASGFGINLQHILHPRGTDEQRARRALKDEQGIESFELSKRSAESNIARDESNNQRDISYAEHLKALEDIQRAAEEGRITRDEAQQAARESAVRVAEATLRERERHNRELEKPKPEAPYTLGRYQVRHNPDGTVVGGVGAQPATMRSRGGRRSRGTSRSSGLSPDIESQIRAAATERGLDPDRAVRRARQRQ